MEDDHNRDGVDILFVHYAVADWVLLPRRRAADFRLQEYNFLIWYFSFGQVHSKFPDNLHRDHPNVHQVQDSQRQGHHSHPK